MGTRSAVVSVLSTEDLAEDLQGDVQDLVDDGVLDSGQGQALAGKLEQVLRSLDRGNANAALRQLESFIHQVEGLVQDGALTPEEGDALIEDAEQVASGIQAGG